MEEIPLCDEQEEEGVPLVQRKDATAVSAQHTAEKTAVSTVAAPAASKGMDRRQLQILIYVLLDWLNFGMIIVVFPLLLLQQVFNGDVALSAYWTGWIGGLQVFLMFLLGPIWGSWSDAIGRKPFLVLSCVASFLYYSMNFMAFMHTLPGNPLVYVLAAALIKGAFFMTQTFENAATVDLSAHDERGKNLALNGAMLGIGLIGGSLISVGLGGLMQHAAPYLVASIFSLGMVIGLVLFRETLKVDMRVPFSWKEANPFSSLVWLLSTPLAWIPVLLYWLVNLIGVAFLASWILWSKGVASALTQTIGMQILLPRFGERAIIIGGISLKGVVVLGMILCPSGNSYLTYFLLHSLSALFGVTLVTVPLIQALISYRVPASEQGRLLAATESARLTSEVLGQFGTTALFAFFYSVPKTTWYHTTDAHLMFAFLCVCACMVLCLIAFYRYEEALFGHARASVVEHSETEAAGKVTKTADVKEKQEHLKSPKRNFWSLLLHKPRVFKETLKVAD